MALAVDRVQRALRKLHKHLQKLPANPSPEDVHRLRTGARHIETIAVLFGAPDQQPVRRLLKSIKPLRKAAGRVRDLDVFTGYAISLPPTPGRHSLSRLVKSLAEMRRDSAGKLLDTVRREQKTAQRHIKRHSDFIGLLSADVNRSPASGTRAHPSERRIGAAATEILRDLGHGPPPDQRNLHRLRLKIKKLRSILELQPNFDRGLWNALGRAKDAIGDWHDWNQLAEIAARLLDARRDRALLDRISDHCRRKLEPALIAAHALRERCQKPLAKKRPSPRATGRLRSLLPHQ